MRIPSREYDGGRACGFSGVGEICKDHPFEYFPSAIKRQKESHAGYLVSAWSDRSTCLGGRIWQG